jgi:hypothetical protein
MITPPSTLAVLRAGYPVQIDAMSSAGRNGLKVISETRRQQ